MIREIKNIELYVPLHSSPCAIHSLMARKAARRARHAFSLSLSLSLSLPSACPPSLFFPTPLPVPVVLGHCRHELVALRPQLLSHVEEPDVPILPPVRHAVEFEERHLLDLLQHVFVQPRGARLVGAVVGDVDIDGIGGLAQVGGGAADKPHEEAVVEFDAAEGAGPQVPELLHFGDEAGDVSQWDADRRLLVEQASNPRVPCAHGEQAVLPTRQARSCPQRGKNSLQYLI
ncbi:unnamed protein product [Spirodela intermedia]|uniref:Uncharacterized protein n=1 Tax=Spirodela intermedia TaxID=51605 RepID=A0A7I8K7Z1_SPIIN|nr:unnamed protein product [Spirodela intermedia]